MYMKYVLTILCSLFLAGCAAGPTAYPYLASNDNCNCEEYRTTLYNIEYTYRARYRMEKGMSTLIDVEFNNRSDDTLSTEYASVKVSSRNVSYQYNDKFVAMPAIIILPGRSDMMQMEGNSRDTNENWNIIAGEQLTLTTRGIRLGSKMLPEMSVVFIPVNPKVRR